MDWRAYVRHRLPSLDISGSREAEIVEELALQLEAACERARSLGASDTDALAAAASEVPDWQVLADSLLQAERPVAARLPSSARLSADPPVPGGGQGHLMMDLLQDFRYAVRSFLRAPRFTVPAVLTLALAMGAALVVSALVDPVLLRPLPFHQPDRLVVVNELSPHGSETGVSWPNFVDWRSRASSIERLAAWRGAPMTLSGQGLIPRRVMGRQVTWDLFDVLGVQPVLGRSFTAMDDRLGAERVALVSHAFWQRELGGSLDAVGRHITVDESPVTVVGVLPRELGSTRTEDLFLPFGTFYPPDHFMMARHNRFGLSAIGRLAPSASEDEARSQLLRVASQLAEEYPESNSGFGATLVPLRETVVRSERPLLVVLLTAVSVLLVLACVNVANLWLVRGTQRTREYKLRCALGASRARIVRQIVTEAAVIAAAATVVGAVLAHLVLSSVVALLPPDFPRLGDVSIDTRILAVAGSLCVAATLICGLGPALFAGSTEASALVRGAREGANRGAGHRALVAGQITLTLVLLTAAGLMVKTMFNLAAVDLGVNTERLLTARVNLPTGRYSADARRDLVNGVEDRIRSMPGVVGAAFTIALPADGPTWSTELVVDDRPTPPRAELPATLWTPVSPSYFETMGVLIAAGRQFDSRDQGNAPQVAIVSETLARRFWPDGSAVGRRIKQGLADHLPWWQIVGVTRDVRMIGVAEPYAMQVYLPLSQLPQVALTIVARTAGDPATAAPGIERAVHAVDPRLAVYGVRTMDQVVGESISRQRLVAALLSSVGVLALLLSVVGVFGVVAYSVSRRTNEIGTRMALGASRGRVLWDVLAPTAWPCLAGLILGVSGGAATTRLLESLLFGVEPLDTSVVAAASLLLIVSTGAACYLPASKAARMDPVKAIREE